MDTESEKLGPGIAEGRARTFDGTEIPFATIGSGPPLLLVPDRARASAYLGDLGGLSNTRTLVRYDARGTGRTAAPDTPAKYAYPSLARDIDALRQAVDVERIDILGHAGGATIASVYAGHFPERVGRLVLVAPEPRFFGVTPVGADVASAFGATGPRAAAERLVRLPLTHPSAELLDLLLRSAPATYARWDTRQRAHAAAYREQFSAAAWFHFDGNGDRTEPGRFLPLLERITGPVLIVTGGADALSDATAGEDAASWFATPRHVSLSEAGRYPWIDAPDLFAQIVASHLKGDG